MIGRTALWRDPSGRVRRVTVAKWGPRTATVEYFDNDRRVIRWKAGRRVNHATRVAVVVYHSELTFVASDGLVKR